MALFFGGVAVSVFALSAREFAAFGEAVFPSSSGGVRGRMGRPQSWRGWLSRRWGVDEATVRRWASGEREVPVWACMELRLMFAARFPGEGLDRALVALEELEAGGVEVPEWSAARDGFIVWLIKEGEPVGIALWDPDRGIVSPRLLLDDGLVRVLSESVRAAESAH